MKSYCKPSIWRVDRKTAKKLKNKKPEKMLKIRKRKGYFKILISLNLKIIPYMCVSMTTPI